MPPAGIIFEAMFDVRPVRSRGVLDLEKIREVRPEINLRRKVTAQVTAAAPATVTPVEKINQPSAPPAPTVASGLAASPLDPSERMFIRAGSLDRTDRVSRDRASPPQTPPQTKIEARELVVKEFEEALARPINIVAELTRIGGELHGYQKRLKPRGYYDRNKIKLSQLAESAKSKIRTGSQVSLYRSVDDFWKTPPPKPARDFVWPTNLPPSKEKPPVSRMVVAPKIPAGHYRSAGEREMDFWLKSTQKLPKSKVSPGRPRPKLSLALWPAAVLAVVALLFWGSASLKKSIFQNGTQAVANLEQAKEDLTKFNFSKAADHFALANGNFNQAAGALNLLGANFLSAFNGIAGTSKVESANALVKAGRHIAKAGESLALAFSNLAEINPFVFVSGAAHGNQQSLTTLIGDFKEILIFAQDNLTRAGELLANVKISALPEDKQQQFANFKEQIPQFQNYLAGAVDYSDFLLKAVGQGGPKRYLVLFQNNSELRATGGFPGSYALIIFDDGYLKNVVVDDIYNIDGQMRENIIPPKPLQHITPNWGMRDANWFADFPTSARKVQEMYRRDGGGNVDGVLTITPDVIARVLDIVGPVELPEYGLSINSSNFLLEIQEEVEYGENRAQPKAIIKDLQPKLWARLAQLDRLLWPEIFKALVEAVQRKQILAYFNEPGLEATAVASDLAGELKNPAGDYLQVVFSNVKGSKSDAFTDNSFALETAVSVGGNIAHRLTINRLHRGGDTPYGFYNRPNTSYIRVYAPKGASLESIQGHTPTDFRPLIGHQDFGFKTDPELDAIETGTSHPFSGVDVFEESGKTVFGFWLVVKPKETKSVVLAYRTPLMIDDDKYMLLWQKQAGTGSDPIRFSFLVPSGQDVASSSEGLRVAGGKAAWSSDLTIDRNISLELK